MTAYRLHFGPLPSASGPRHHVLHIRAEGGVVRASGASLPEALAHLNAQPDTKEAWCGASELGGDEGPPPRSEQVAAAFRLLMSELDPDLDLDCSNDAILHGLVAAIAALYARDPERLPIGTHAYHFTCEGVYTGSGHVVLSASGQGFSCFATRSADDLHTVFSSPPTKAPQDIGVNMIGLSTAPDPHWACDAMHWLTGQAFAPELFVCVHGAAAPCGPKSALLLALLFAAWPQNPQVGQIEQTDISLPAGQGRVTLTPISF